MVRSLWRRSAGIYLALFYVAVAVAPHHHVNGLEDLLLDQRSDSGRIVETGGPAGTAAAPALNNFWLVDDFPCLACFNGDYVSAPAALSGFTPSLQRLASDETPSFIGTARLLPRESPSRAPPSLA